MRLFQKLDFLPVLALIALLFTSTTISSVALADQRHFSRNDAYSPSGMRSQYSFSSNSGYSNSRFSRNRAYNSRSNYFPNNYPNQYTRFVQNQARSNYFRNNNYQTNNYFINNRFNNRFNNRNRDSWSVSLNFGNNFNRSGFNTNVWNYNSWNHFTPYPVFNSYNTHTRIITSPPTVIYVNESTPYSASVPGNWINYQRDKQRAGNTIYSTKVSSSRLATAGRSLLKDLQGNCFERSYDSRGRESRVQLPETACNY